MEYRLRHEGGVLRLTITGEVTRAELGHVLTEVAAIEATLPRQPHRLTDVSGVTRRDTDYQFMRGIAAERAARQYPNAYKHAYVAPASTSFGFARMFQTLNANPQIEVRIFETAAEAEAWLAEPSPA